MNTKPILTLALVGLLAACGNETTTNLDAGGGDGGLVDAGQVKLDTSAKIEAFLAANKLTMEGANIPSHPNGFDENLNLEAGTQCYNQTVMTFSAGVLSVATKLGTLKNAPMKFNVGMCDRATVLGNPLMFSSTAFVIENVQGDADCFDITVTYVGFAQEGRGKISADRKTVTLELFFKDQAAMHRCAAGAVGTKPLTLNGMPFTGNAQQVYAVTAN